MIETMAGYMQHGVGCLDGANNLTKTLRARADSEPSRAVLALGIKAACAELAQTHDT